MSTFKKNILTNTFFNLLGKGAGFFIPFVISWLFGVSSETDGFFYAYGLILFITNMFAIVLESIIVPFVVERRCDKEKLGKFVTKILFWSWIIIAPVTALFIYGISITLPLFTKFNAHQVQLVVSIIIETSPLSLLIASSSILAGVFNALNKFSFSAFSPIIRAAVAIGCFFYLYDEMGIHAVAVGYVVGEIARLMYFIIIVNSCKTFKFSLDFKLTEDVVFFMKCSSLQVFAMVSSGLNPIIDKTMATWFNVGSVSLIEYGDRLNAILITLISSGVLTVVLSNLSESLELNKIDVFNLRVKMLSIKIFKISLLISIPFVCLAYPISAISYGHVNFPSDKIKEISIVFAIYTLGLSPYVMSQVYVRGLLALKSTKMILYGAMWKNMTNIVLNVLLVWIFGFYGIVVSSALGSMLMLYIFRFYFNQEISRRRVLCHEP